MGNERQIDYGGNTLIVETIRVGATGPGQAGTDLELTAGEFALISGITAGTAAASKALVLGTSGEIGTVTTATITNLNVSSINLTTAAAPLTSHAATLTTNAATVTTEALTTAAGASQAFVLTKTGVAAGDLAFVQGAGGTNTREHIAYKAITTTDTITVTVTNIGPTDALNGTLIFNVWVLTQ